MTFKVKPGKEKKRKIQVEGNPGDDIRKSEVQEGVQLCVKLLPNASSSCNTSSFVR